MTPLAPCVACHRHIRVDHAACPFCAAAVPASFAARVIPSARGRLDRVALFTFALAFSGAACGQVVVDDEPAGNQGVLPPEPDGGSARVDSGAAGVMYGASPVDAGKAIDAAADADWFDAGAPGPMYGAARSDAGDIDAGPPADDGGIFVLYGMPPPGDGG